MARKAKKAKVAWRYMTIWCDKKGKIRQQGSHKIEYACEQFRMAQADAVHVEMCRCEGPKDITLLEWDRYAKAKTKVTFSIAA